jgi:hypothetical protein
MSVLNEPYCGIAKPIGEVAIAPLNNRHIYRLAVDVSFLLAGLVEHWF